MSWIVIIPAAMVFMSGCRSVKPAQILFHRETEKQESEVCEIVKKGFAASPTITDVSKCSIVDTVPRAEGTSYRVKYTVNVRQVDDAGVIHDKAMDLGVILFRGRDGKWKPGITATAEISQ